MISVISPFFLENSTWLRFRRFHEPMQSTQRSVPLDVGNAWLFTGFSHTDVGQNRMVISWASHSHGKTSIWPPPCNFQMTFVIFVNPFVGKFANRDQTSARNYMSTTRSLFAFQSFFEGWQHIHGITLYLLLKTPRCHVLRLSQLLPGHCGQTRAVPSVFLWWPTGTVIRWWRW